VTPPTAAVLLTGNELLRGVIADRNAAHLAQRLERLGVRVVRVLVVGDEVDDIAAGLRELLQAADLVVTSGGLGPTHDDRTVEAVAAAAGVPLRPDEGILEQITRWTDTYAARSGTDPARYATGNRKQAHIPDGAQVLGLAGTAPGLVLALGEKRVVVLPGVPSELRRLFDDAPSHPLLAELFAGARERDRWVTRTYGISESRVADLFAEAGGDQAGIETSICARNYEIEIDVRADRARTEEAAGLVRRLRDALGEHVFATDEQPLPETVLELARRRGVRIATAESCTGGMVAAELTSVPGSSEAFAGGAVTYSDELKTRLLGVPEELLARHGAVSAEVAEAMAVGARERLAADVAVSVTGVAGPGGGSEEKPVGLVYLHVSSPWGSERRRMQWPGGRADVRMRATVAALHMLRVHLDADSARSIA
jgi:nicotinamide-nucleotide amidase